MGEGSLGWRGGENNWHIEGRMCTVCGAEKGLVEGGDIVKKEGAWKTATGVSCCNYVTS